MDKLTISSIKYRQFPWKYFPHTSTGKAFCILTFVVNLEQHCQHTSGHNASRLSACKERLSALRSKTMWSQGLVVTTAKVFLLMWSWLSNLKQRIKQFFNNLQTYLCIFACHLPKKLSILILFITKPQLLLFCVCVFLILTISMMWYLYKNPAPSSATWHVLTRQCQGHFCYV